MAADPFRLWSAAGRKTRPMEPAMHTTWKPHEKHGDLTERSDLPDSVFAFPKQRKEPLTDCETYQERDRAFRPDRRRVG